jgi:hypothetical protein
VNKEVRSDIEPDDSCMTQIRISSSLGKCGTVVKLELELRPDVLLVTATINLLEYSSSEDDNDGNKRDCPDHDK